MALGLFVVNGTRSGISTRGRPFTVVIGSRRVVL